MPTYLVKNADPYNFFTSSLYLFLKVLVLKFSNTLSGREEPHQKRLPPTGSFGHSIKSLAEIRKSLVLLLMKSPRKHLDYMQNSEGEH